MKKKKKKGTNLIFVLGFLLGLSILLYPTISDKWNSYRAEQLISHYVEEVEEEEEAPDIYGPMLEAAYEYNEGIKREAVPDAFSVRDGLEDPVYDELVNVDGEGLMGSIEIPAIDANLPIYHYTTNESLEKGVGHLFGSSLPVGGASTHTVLSAHRGLPTSKLFTDLPLLEVGDVFYLHIMGDVLAYEVDQILTVEPHEVESLAIADGLDQASLVTCTPYGVNTHRLLVRGHRIEFVEEQYAEVQKQAPKVDTEQIGMQAVCVVIGLVLAVVIVAAVNIIDIVRRKKRRKKKNQENNLEK